ncbi:MAG: T9SS type A sorting domain-containing protein [Bacteroidota bacterium]|nr:T9SS type A sorting domain-containing protein [Bacteroidota bacterium]
MKNLIFLFITFLLLSFNFKANAQCRVEVNNPNRCYSSLEQALDSINAGIHCGDIIVTVLDSLILERPGKLYRACYNSIKIVPGRPDLPIIFITGNDSAIFELYGVRNFTIDGGLGKGFWLKNKSSIHNSAVILFSSSDSTSSSDSLGSNNNTVMNCRISCGINTDSAGSNQSFGIFVGGPTISLSSQGRNNNNNKFIGNIITKCMYGIAIIGGGAANPNDSNVISGNIIGPSSHGPDQIGRWGIFTQFQNNCTISENIVQYVGGPFSQGLTGGDRGGIGVGGNSWASTPSFTTGGNYTVTKNKINNILEERTFSAVGILCATTRSGVNTNNLIANNEIYNIRANGILGDAGIGIGHNGNNSGDLIVYNSIYMAGDIDPQGTVPATQSSCGIRIATLTDSNTTVKNNSIYVNINSNNASLLHSCIQMPDSTYQFGSAELDNNDYFPDSPVLGPNPQMRLGAKGTSSAPTRFYATLADWRALFTPFPQDLNSISADPIYSLTEPNYLIPSTIFSPLKMAADPITGITNDILGELRNSFAPTIGCYEFDSITLPVDLTALTATVLNRRDVRINWATASEVNNSGFDIERADINGQTSNDWRKVGFVEGNRTSTTSNNYTFIDRGLNTGKYNYRLKQIDFNGNYEYFNLSYNIEIGIPSVYNLSQNYPNPFNPITKIDYDIPYEGKVRIVLYDVSGREVAKLINDARPAGYYTLNFNALNFASGVYFYSLIAKDFFSTKKMMILK